MRRTTTYRHNRARTIRRLMKRLRANITWEACGLGLFWAWCYCLWFVPNLYSSGTVVSPGQNHSWLVVLGSAAVIQFAVPACLKTRRLSSHPLLAYLVPIITCVGTICIELTSTVLPLEWLYYLGAIASGASSALLWHLWGDYYAATRNDNAESIALGFGIVVLFFSRHRIGLAPRALKRLRRGNTARIGSNPRRCKDACEKSQLSDAFAESNEEDKQKRYCKSLHDRLCRLRYLYVHLGVHSARDPSPQRRCHVDRRRGRSHLHDRSRAPEAPLR